MRISYLICLFAGICLLLVGAAIVRAQKPELVMQTGHSSAVDNIWLSPDENTVISQSVEKLIFWDIKTRRIRREVTNVKSFFISPDNETVATLDKDYLKLDLWKAENGTYLTSVINFYDWSFSHDGKTLVSTHENGLLQIWDSPSNKASPLLIPTKQPIRSFLFGPGNRFVVFSTDDNDGSLSIINLDSRNIYVLAKGIAFWSLTPDGRYLLAQDRQQTFRDTEIVIFENNIYLKPVFSRTGMTSWKVSPRGTYLAFNERDQSTNFYELKSGQLKLSIPNAPWDLKFTDDGEMVYREHFSKVFESYDINTGTKLPPLKCDYPKVTIGPDRKLLFADNRSPRSSFLWDLNKGQQVFRISEEPDQEISSSVFSAEGQTLAIVKSSRANNTSITLNVSLWNVKTGEEKLIYEYSMGQRANFNVYNTGAGFGPGGGGSGPTFQPITLVANAKTPIEGNLAFSDRADLLVVGESSGNISLCDVTTAKQLFVFRSHSAPVQVFFGDNEKALSIYNNFNTYRLWDSNSGNISEEKAKPVVKLDEGKNEKFEVVQKDQTYTLRNKKTAAIVFEAKGIRMCELSRDNKKVLCERATAEQTECNLDVWDVDSKESIFSQTNVQWSPHLSPDGKFLSLTRKMENGFRAEVWGIKKKQLLLQHQDQGSRARYAFTPDSKIAILRNNLVHKSIKNLGVEEYSLELWSLADAKKILSLDHVFEYQFSLDKHELIAILKNKILKWDLRTHTGIETEFTPSNNIMYVLGGMTFSRTGPKTNSLIFFTPQSHRSEFESGVVFLWNTRKNQLYTLKDHSAQITSAEFSDDEKYLLTSSEDGTIRLWKTDDGQLQLTLVLVNQTDWLLTTPAGFFDGTPYAWKQLSWRFNNNNLEDASVDLYFNDFFRPNLLEEIIAENLPHQKPGKELENIDRRQPEVEITLINGHDKSQFETQAATDKRMASVFIEVTDNADKKKQANHQESSGARDLRLFRNGSLVKVWRGNVFDKTNGCEVISADANKLRRARCEAEIPIMAGDNNFTAYAFNSSNVKSSDNTVTIKGADVLKRKGILYVLAIGIGQYENSQYDLNYTVTDTQSFCTALVEHQEKVGHFERVKVVSLLNEQARKADILAALKTFAETTQPEDAVVLYFSGHGKARGDHFYLVPQDLGYVGRRDQLSEAGLEQILARSISDLELEDAFRDIDAGQIFMIIDACNSGQMLENKDEPRRGPMNSKGLAQLAYEKGMYILTASQNVEEAFVSDKLKHSYLTYALVEDGLKTNAADADHNGEVTLREWFTYAASRVPKLRAQALQSKLLEEFTPKLKAERSRNSQTPRVFYRREPDTQPLIVAKVGGSG